MGNGVTAPGLTAPCKGGASPSRCTAQHPLPGPPMPGPAPAKPGGEGLSWPGTGAHGLSPALEKGRGVAMGVSGPPKGGVRAPAALLRCAEAGTAGARTASLGPLAALLLLPCWDFKFS